MPASPSGGPVPPTPVPPLELRAPAPLLTPLLDALRVAGLDPHTAPLPSGLVVLAHTGSPAPDLADDLVRRSRPHLLVGLPGAGVGAGPGADRDGHVVLGPFVDPGLTACLHCLYAARAPVGPASPLADTFRATVSHADTSHAASALAASLLAVAAACLAHDVRRWAGGLEPATWSATVRVDATLSVTRHEWPRHPQCGCTWSLPA